MRFTFLFLCAVLVLASCENKEEDTRKYPPADLVFYETYTTDEIQASWMKVIEVVNRPDTSQVIHANAFSGIDLRTLIQPAGDMCLGNVAPVNQQRVQELLSMDIVRECLPKDAEILWSWNAEDVGAGQKMYSLYVVHKKWDKTSVNWKRPCGCRSRGRSEYTSDEYFANDV